MAHTDEIRSEDLKLVIDQIEELIAELVEDEFAVAPGESFPTIRLGETFALWMLDIGAIDSFKREGGDLLRLARNTGRWHHQIKFDSEGKGYARSIAPATHAESISLTQLFLSPLAVSIDKAVDWVDANMRNDPLIRLLVVPAYQAHVFWMIDEARGESEVLVIDAPFQSIALERNLVISSRDFIEALAKEPPITGLED